VLEYYEYTPYYAKLASQVASILPFGINMTGFMWGLFGLLDAPLGRYFFLYEFDSITRSIFLMIRIPLCWIFMAAMICVGSTSDCLLIITNKRYELL
jgi:hypothetical protein